VVTGAGGGLEERGRGRLLSVVLGLLPVGARSGRLPIAAMGDLNSKGYILVLHRGVGLTVAAAKGLKLTGAFMYFPFHGFLLFRLIKITSFEHLFH
jgi:hypothetical protein